MACRPRSLIGLVDRNHQEINLTRQCALLGISRSSLYYQPQGVSPLDQQILNVLDEIYTECPFYGKRRLTWKLNQLGFSVGKKKVRSLMKILGIEALGPSPNTSKQHPQHPKYPYLLKNKVIKAPNQVWATDITYIRLHSGWLYLVAIMDWYSRYVVSWNFSVTLDTEFCLQALNTALRNGPHPAIFNSDQGSQFTSLAFTQILIDHGIQISMDGRARFWDNIFIERFW